MKPNDSEICDGFNDSQHYLRWTVHDTKKSFDPKDKIIVTFFQQGMGYTDGVPLNNALFSVSSENMKLFLQRYSAR